MGRIYTTFLLLGISLLLLPSQAQNIDESFVFMDKEGNIIENGATGFLDTASVVFLR